MSQGSLSHPTPAHPPVDRRIEITADDRVASLTLLNGDGKLWIEHAGECYLLRRTANNRLILTK